MKRRSKYIAEICELLDADNSRRDNQVSAQATHKMYVTVTGNPAKPMDGRGWHIRKVNKALKIETNKGYYNDDAQITQDVLKQWQEWLQEQQ